MKSYCIYCGENVDWEPDGMAEAHRKMMEHDRVCPKNPMVQELAEYDSLFKLQRTRLGKATQLWQEATGKHNVLPDLGDLLDWMLEDNRQLKAENARLAARLVELQGCVGPPSEWNRALSDLIGPTLELLERLSAIRLHENYVPFDEIERELARLRAAREGKP